MTELNTSSLDGKVALVTGASRGIGLAIAQGLAEAGATVVGTATTDAGADHITAYLNKMGAKGAGIVMNVADGESVKMAFDGLKSKFELPSIVINNAGITRDNILLRMKDDEWDSVMNTNLSSVFRVTKLCLRGMSKARWGRIINIGSVVGSTGNAGQANYAAAKAGLEGFTRSVAREFGSRNITANVVAPGFIDTDMTKDLPDAQRDVLLAQIPLARLGEPSDIAQTVVFLCGKSGSYISGACIPVNGGMNMS
ncbi:MAG: 3-oxoacyl-ACP reductase FabG [Pseudomonadales bacterium]|nr:3-oxoacyl-ACP reductase FabG [Pseudomonadales bacterium]